MVDTRIRTLPTHYNWLFCVRIEEEHFVAGSGPYLDIVQCHDFPRSSIQSNKVVN